MRKPTDSGGAAGRAAFSQRIDAKVARKLDAQRRSTEVAWFGLGMMGLIGWSVTVPTLLGAALGAWLDKHHPGGHSWTLALLVAGLVLGCWNAWHWMSREGAQMQAGQGEDSAGRGGDGARHGDDNE